MNLLLTAMIWRMERRTVVAAIVGGNCNMHETLAAIWADVTIQPSALVPVLRLIALRAMSLSQRISDEALSLQNAAAQSVMQRLTGTHIIRIFPEQRRLTEWNISGLSENQKAESPW